MPRAVQLPVLLGAIWLHVPAMAEQQGWASEQTCRPLLASFESDQISYETLVPSGGRECRLINLKMRLSTFSMLEIGHLTFAAPELQELAPTPAALRAEARNIAIVLKTGSPLQDYIASLQAKLFAITLDYAFDRSIRKARSFTLTRWRSKARRWASFSYPPGLAARISGSSAPGACRVSLFSWSR